MAAEDDGDGASPGEPTLSCGKSLRLDMKEGGHPMLEQAGTPTPRDEVQVARPGHDDRHNPKPGGEPANDISAGQSPEITDVHVAWNGQWDTRLLEVKQDEAACCTVVLKRELSEGARVGQLLWEVALQDCDRDEGRGDR